LGILYFIQKKNAGGSSEQIIRRLVHYMPGFYQSHVGYKNCIDFVERHELEWALESLIVLALDSGHYFAEEYWADLAVAAGEMNMKKEVAICRQQIDRNIRDVKFKTPFGWTTQKFDDNHYTQYISDVIKDKWASDRREQDNISALIDEDGIHQRSRGRTGFIYCINKKRVAEVEFELGTKGLILYFESVVNWVLPTKTNLAGNEKQVMKQQIADWAALTGNAIDFN